MKHLKNLALLAVWLFVLASSEAAAEQARTTDLLDQRISVLSAEGQHFNAVLKFREDPERQLVDRLAAARSAWALGLVGEARTLWDEALADDNFQGAERTQVTFSRAVLELQEGRFDTARAIAERELPALRHNPDRAQFSLVIAEALSAQGAYSKAAEYYSQALDLSSPSDRQEARYLLAKNQIKLGRVSTARSHLTKIGLDSSYASRAILELIEIDFQDRNYHSALRWIEQGRSRFPNQFETPWIRYVAVSSLIERGDIGRAEDELEQFVNHYSSHEHWLILSQAAFEAGRTEVLLRELKKSVTE